MSNAVPEGWSYGLLSDFSEVNPKLSQRATLKPDTPVSFIRMEDVSNEAVVKNVRVEEYKKVAKGFTAFQNSDVLVAKITPCFENGKGGYVSNLKNGVGFGSTEFHVLRSRPNSAPGYLYQFSTFHEFRLSGEANMTGSAGQRRVPTDYLKTLDVVFPPLPEQQKIAAILSSVDDVIEKTRAQIDKLKDLKTGMMQELLTKGIGHTAFKDSPVGRIPEGWDVVPYSAVVKVVMPSIKLSDSEQYCPVVVRRRHMGVETRGSKEGSKILVKSQFQVVPGTFLISRRQIFHGSCGLVPLNIDKRAIISKEYLALEATSELDIRFLDYFSHSEEFHQQIVRTTYGVDVEKFVFKDKWWMKELIPLPPVQEQKKICEILDSIAERIETGAKHLNQCLSIKKALMQDLLTGKVRVSVDNKETAVA